MPAERRANMFLELGSDPRGWGDQTGTELETLMTHLTWHRATLELKCADLTPEELARRPAPPSTMSLLGLVRHLADVERGWFRRRMARLDAPKRYSTPENPDGDFEGAVPDPEVVADAFAAWHEEIEFSDAFVASAPDLDVVGDHPLGPFSLRELLVHMVEEYARHNGHADLLRELIDGRVGQ